MEHLVFLLAILSTMFVATSACFVIRAAVNVVRRLRSVQPKGPFVCVWCGDMYAESARRFQEGQFTFCSHCYSKGIARQQ